MATKPAPRPLSVSTSRRALLGAAIGAVVALAVLAVRGTSLGASLELRLVDLRTRAFVGGRAPDPSIVICQIEEYDVAQIKRDLNYDWPWPLDLNQAAFELFAKAGVRTVLVDVLHLDRGQGPDDYGSTAPLTPEQQARLEGEVDAAVAYGTALGKAHAVLALELSDTSQYEGEVRRRAVEGKLGTGAIAVPAGAAARRGANLPARRVADGAVLVGFVNVVPDVDGVIRRAHVVGRWGDRPVLSLAVAGVVVARGAPPRLVDDRLVVGDATQPLDADASFLVDFRGPPRTTYRKVTASQVLAWATAAGDGPAPADARAALADAIVVWGVNLSGMKDIVGTPISGTFDGPEYQATIVDNLLHGSGRVHAPRAVDLAILFAMGVLLGAATGAMRRRWLPVVLLVAAVATITALGWLAFAAGRVIDLGAPASAGMLAWAATTMFLLLTEGRYNKWLEGAFGMYLAPSVIDALKGDPGLLALGGAQREVTILFSDVAGFSTFSRQLGPQRLVQLLNAYLTTHGEAIHAEGGTISKFIGDAVMAVYGDPVPQPDQAVRACRTALDVQRRIPTLRPLWESMGLTSFAARIGLNSGTANVGNMGSSQRFDYTVMGDVVNLSSRLEGANKYFGTKILLGPATFTQAQDAILAKAIGRVIVVGWDTPEPVYELVAMREGATADLVAHVAAWDRATAAMRAGDLAGAAAALADAERLRPGDGACAWLGKVLAAMRAGTEPTPWSGVVRLEGKG